MANRHFHPGVRLILAIGTIVLCLAAAEGAMRYYDWPRTVISGWRATVASGPFNQYGWRGQPRQKRDGSEFVVAITGGANVECAACPADETLDVMLERAIRPYSPKARVVALGGTGYGQDQEYLALQEFFGHEHADLVVVWAVIEDDIPANTFRTARKRTGEMALKPTFAWNGGELRGPTEVTGHLVYGWKLSTLVWPMLVNLDRNWTVLLPPADPGAGAPPPRVASHLEVDDPLEQQRSAWSIWLTPRPARVSYGISLTQGLLRHMRDLATLNGARFAVLLTPTRTDGMVTAPVALEHRGHWFVADPAVRDATIAELTGEFEPIALQPEADAPASPAAERRTMARLAEALNQRELLNDIQIARPRH